MSELQNTSKADIASLVLNPLDFAAPPSVKEALLVQEKKPKDDFVRVCVDPKYRSYFSGIKLNLDKNAGRLYLVSPTIASHIPAKINSFEVLTVVNRAGVPALWALRTPQEGRANSWTDTEREAAKRAETDWVKIVSNDETKSWDIFVAKADLGEPVWPSRPFAELVRLAFADRIIETTDHPIARRLRGEL